MIIQGDVVSINSDNVKKVQLMDEYQIKVYLSPSNLTVEFVPYTQDCKARACNQPLSHCKDNKLFVALFKLYFQETAEDLNKYVDLSREELFPLQLAYSLS